MKLLLLHGSAKTASRKKLIESKLKFDTNNVIIFEEGSNIQNILGVLVTSSLFEEERLIILENPAEDFTDYPLIHNPYTVILWFDHEVSEKKPIMQWAKANGQVLYFPEGREISAFPFLDKLAARDKNAYLELDKLKKAEYDTQYLITMIFYLLRNLVATPKTAKDFVRNKNAQMKKNFSAEEITKLYKDVLEIDFKIKSGLLEKDHAEFLLVNLFCQQIQIFLVNNSVV